MLAFKRLAIALSSDDKNRKTVIGVLLIKFGLLYPAAVALLWSGICSRAAFAIGLTLMLAWSSLSVFKRSERSAHV